MDNYRTLISSLLDESRVVKNIILHINIINNILVNIRHIANNTSIFNYFDIII